MPETVSVIIVSYNVSALLRDCLKSVFTQGISCEVIVVDNASTDDSVAMVTRDFPQVKLIVNNRNAGFSAANNQGLKVSTGDYIFLLNPDTVLAAGAINYLVAYCVLAKTELLVGPRLENSDGSLQISAWKLPNPWDMISEALFLHRLLKVGQYRVSRFDSTFEAGMLSGAALFFSRSIYIRLGGLDEELFWMEDADYAKRAWDNKITVLYLSGTKVTHHSGQSAKKNLKRVIANQLLSKLKYYRKHFGYLLMLFTSLFCLFHIVSRIILFGITSVFSQVSAEKAGAYWFSLGRFFRYLFTGDKRIS